MNTLFTSSTIRCRACQNDLHNRYPIMGSRSSMRPHPLVDKRPKKLEGRGLVCIDYFILLYIFFFRV